MKKIFSVLIITSLAVGTFTANAQYISPGSTYKNIIQGGAGDTAHASVNIVGIANLLPAAYISTVKIQCRIDSLGGTPAGTAKLYFSNDGTNWDAAATTSVTWTFTTGMTPGTGANDTIFNISATSVTAAYAKLIIATTSGTQKIKAKATLLSAH